MPDVQFIGFRTIVIENSARTVTFLGYGTVVLAKGLCTQSAYITGPACGAKSFDSGAWSLTCGVRRINKTGEIRVDAPAIKGHDNMYHNVLKFASGVRELIQHELTPHLPTEEEITRTLQQGK